MKRSDNSISSLTVHKSQFPHLYKLKQLMDKNNDLNSVGALDFNTGDVENKEIIDRVYSYIKGNWNSIEKELKEGSSENSTIRSLKNNIDTFFSEMKSGVKDNADEVVFDGDKYLCIEPDFFDKWFKREGNKWVFHNKEES